MKASRTRIHGGEGENRRHIGISDTGPNFAFHCDGIKHLEARNAMRRSEALVSDPLGVCGKVCAMCTALRTSCGCIAMPYCTCPATAVETTCDDWDVL